MNRVVQPPPLEEIPRGCVFVLPDCTLWPPEANGNLRFAFARHIGRIIWFPEIKRWHRKRTLQQLRLVMGTWMDVILDAQGYGHHDRDAVYEHIKLQCWYRDLVSPVTGQIIRVAKSTKNLDVVVYGEFITAFKNYVEDQDTGLGILLPEADPTKARR